MPFKNNFQRLLNIVRDKCSKPFGMGLTNSVVGIIGCGNIGISLAEMLSGFKLSELLYTSRKPKPEGKDVVGYIMIL